jgi:hypothetical protein
MSSALALGIGELGAIPDVAELEGELVIGTWIALGAGTAGFLRSAALVPAGWATFRVPGGSFERCSASPASPFYRTPTASRTHKRTLSKNSSLPGWSGQH